MGRRKYIYLSLTDTAERGKKLYECLEEWLKEAGINENGGFYAAVQYLSALIYLE